MPVNPEAEIQKLVTRMRVSADFVVNVKEDRTGMGFANAEELQQHDRALSGAAIDLRQGANTIEDLLVMGQMATDVWDIAARKGCLFVTDSVSLSDNLVGFFVPAAVMNRLGEYVVQLKAHA